MDTTTEVYGTSRGGKVLHTQRPGKTTAYCGATLPVRVALDERPYGLTPCVKCSVARSKARRAQEAQQLQAQQVLRHPVAYEVRTANGWVPMTSHVLVGGGYTTEVDVPAILAVAHSVDVERVRVTQLGKGRAL